MLLQVATTIGCVADELVGQDELGLGVVAVRLCQVPGNSRSECFDRGEFCSHCLRETKKPILIGHCAAMRAMAESVYQERLATESADPTINRPWE